MNGNNGKWNQGEVVCRLLGLYLVSHICQSILSGFGLVTGAGPISPAIWRPGRILFAFPPSDDQVNKAIRKKLDSFDLRCVGSSWIRLLDGFLQTIELLPPEYKLAPAIRTTTRDRWDLKYGPVLSGLNQIIGRTLPNGSSHPLARSACGLTCIFQFRRSDYNQKGDGLNFAKGQSRE